MNRNALTSAALLLTVALSGCAGEQETDSSPIMAEGSSRYPDQTAQDWVTYSDYALLVSVIDERRGEASETEKERGEGIVPRTVILRTNDVLWRNPAATEKAPDEFTYEASGWVFGANGDDSDELRPFALAESPRLQKGHRYVVAIKWNDARCAEGDEKVPAQWVGLGNAGKIPFDGVGGVGEYEGREQSLAEAEKRAQSRPAEAGQLFADQTIGHDSGWVANQLQNAEPMKAEEYDNTAPC